ncbi:MAG: dCMP deaminase family protein [Acinetobacter sp.]|uniref:deoxycytidylate deaminase n=1 Tax=Acinetobacter sp. TaxID=472 RepID=UPI0026352F9A|nr:dCMP deaminase family protein [Acinetobacter sp.]MDD2944911.1 dCMP deaminase family protein [Acinetobacter sp.]
MQSTRESKQVYFLKIAALVATRATCPRRSVGCVITNKYGHIKATGYNGVPKGMDHCTDKPCGGESSKSSEGLSSCMATHAEQNALLQCDNTMDIDTIYCTTSPCIHCAKLIANTSCKKVVYADKYIDTSGEDLLMKLGIEVEHIRIADNSTEQIYLRIK